MESNILREAAEHVRRLYETYLPENRRFHNYHHTLMVVQGCRDIVAHEGISQTEKEILELAAWFHDAGYINAYQDHEEESKKFAKSFLEEANYPKQKIQLVLEIIDATCMPQNPQNNLQKIICDADMFHLAQPDYFALLNRLRLEWSIVLEKQYSEEEWKEVNIKFLSVHNYFTEYGKKVLQKLKEDNIKHLENGC